ncbi:MAG: hypothetical protein QNK23_13335 [Crocinitomicaceae bacterium]|nr:hypothetical protein [Crocinitomicaceae bacterium]
MKNSKDFFEFAMNILNRPGMFLVNNVEDFQLVLFGYCAATDTNVGTYMEGFEKMLNQKYFSNSTDFNWVKIIRLHSSTDLHTLELLKDEFTKWRLDFKFESSDN